MTTDKGPAENVRVYESELSKLDRLFEGAASNTPFPWSVITSSGISGHGFPAQIFDGVGKALCDFWDLGRADDAAATYMGAAANAVPRLIAECRALAAEHDALKRLRDIIAKKQEP